MAYILLESTHVLENGYNVNIKIIACQIIGPAAAGSAGPVPTARAAVGMGIPMGIPMGMGMVWVWGLR